MRFISTGARALLVAGFAAVFVAAPQPAPVAAADPAGAVIANARHHLGAPWRWGRTGPGSFDCSGLVYHAFRDAGLASRIGGLRSARGYLSYFRSRGLTSRVGSRGDLVVWGGGSHIGIYIGNGYAISTLTSGVKIHKVHAVIAPFTAYLKTGLSSSTSWDGGAPARAQSNSSRRTVTTPRTSAVRAGTSRVTTAWRLNFRTGPGKSYRIQTVLRQGTVVSVLGSGRDSRGRTWYKVQKGNRTGWVAGWFTRSA